MDVGQAAAAFGIDPERLQPLAGASGSAWSDGEVVLRVGDRVAHEVPAMEAAAGHVPVPRVLAYNDGAVLLERLPGRPAGELAIERPDRAAATGHACAALHDALAAVAAPPELGPGERLLHLDLHPFNVLVADDGRVTGVIDWANAQAGEPELDRARTWSILTLDPAAQALRRHPGWVTLTEQWLDALPGFSPAARAWACEFMLDDLEGRHSPAELAPIRRAARLPGR